MYGRFIRAFSLQWVNEVGGNRNQNSKCLACKIKTLCWKMLKCVIILSRVLHKEIHKWEWDGEGLIFHFTLPSAHIRPLREWIKYANLYELLRREPLFNITISYLSWWKFSLQYASLDRKAESREASWKERRSAAEFSELSSPQCREQIRAVWQRGSVRGGKSSWRM